MRVELTVHRPQFKDAFRPRDPLATRRYLIRATRRVDRPNEWPDEKIEARFPRTFDNLRQALTFVDEALLLDNSSSDQPFRFVAAFRNGKRQRRKGYAPAWAAFLG